MIPLRSGGNAVSFNFFRRTCSSLLDGWSQQGIRGNLCLVLFFLVLSCLVYKAPSIKYRVSTLHLFIHSFIHSVIYQRHIRHLLGDKFCWTNKKEFHMGTAHYNLVERFTIVSYSWSSLLANSVLVNLPTCWDWLITPKSVLTALLWSFARYMQSSEKFESPNMHLPSWGQTGHAFPFCFCPHTDLTRWQRRREQHGRYKKLLVGGQQDRGLSVTSGTC